MDVVGIVQTEYKAQTIGCGQLLAGISVLVRIRFEDFFFLFKPDFGIFSVFLYSMCYLRIRKLYLKTNKKAALVSVRDKGREKPLRYHSYCRENAAAPPHHPWARDDNGPPPSAPNPGMPFQPDAPG